jgi:ribosomal protein L40E
MLFCKKCGTQLDDDAEFCHLCGTTVPKTKSSSKAHPAPEPDAGQTIQRDGPVYGIVNLENLPAGHIIDERDESG